jgi:hypothetical protein
VAVGIVAWSAATAEKLLSPLGRRWAHVQAVGRRASEVADQLLDGDEAEVLVAAAYLHDIGYAPTLAVTGFHPLDGGRWLRDRRHERLAGLVAHHSGARNEAALRGFGPYLEFTRETSLVATALTYCDMTTGPGGEPVTVGERIAEIVRRYGAGHVVAQAIVASTDEVLAGERELTRLLKRASATGRSPGQ